MGRKRKVRKNATDGEKRVRQVLDEMELKAESEKTFDDLVGVNGGKLRFDFYVPSERAAIEYNGPQHYKPMEKFGGTQKFRQQKAHDKLKREYCKENDIELIEIPYTEYDDIENILRKKL